MFGGSKPPFGLNTTTPGFGFNNSATTSPFGQSTFGKTQAPSFGAAPSFGQQSSSLFGGATQSTGLFGANNAAPAFGANVATTQQQSGFGGFGQPQQNTSLFGTNQTNANTSLFGATTNAGFGVAAKQTPFGFNATQPTSLFGSTNANTTQTAGGSFFPQAPTTSGLFGAGTPGFGGQTGGTGTAIAKYQPSHGTDTLMKNGQSNNVNTKQHCITAMKEYENKSLEELRLEDYLENRKGPQAGQTTSLFGANPTTNLFGSSMPQQSTGLFGIGQDQNKNLFGNQTTASGFGQTNTGFGAPAQNSLFNKTFTGTATATTAGFSGFNNTTTTSNLFGNKSFGQTQPGGGIFGQPATSTANTFGQSSFFGNTPQQQQQPNQLFAAPENKGFGIGSTQQPNTFNGFGTNANAQNNSPFSLAKPPPNFNFGVSTAQPAPAVGGGFGFGQQQNQSGSLFGNTAFGNKPATSSFGGFGTQTNPPLLGGGGLNLNQNNNTSFFNTNQNKPGGLFGNMTGQNNGSLFGNNSFGTNNTLGGFSNTNLGIGNAGLGTTAPNNIQQQIMALSSTPYGDAAIFKDLKSSGATEESLKVTDPATQKAILESVSNQYKVSQKPRNAIKTKPVVGLLSKKSLFEGLEEHDSSVEESFSLVISSRRLIIKKKVNQISLNQSVNENNSSVNSPVRLNLQSAVTNTNVIENRSPSTLNNNNNKHILNQSEIQDDFTSEIPRNPTSSENEQFARRESWLSSNTLDKVRRNNNRTSDQTSIENTISEYTSDNIINKNRITTSSSNNVGDSSLTQSPHNRSSPTRFMAQTSTESILSRGSFINESNLETTISEFEPNAAGVVLKRSGYYTIPALDELSSFLKDDGTCIVPNFTVGRKGYGNVYFNEPIDVTGMNLDTIVFFRNKEVTIYPDDDTKPSQGEGLNRKAQITLDQVWPSDKTLHEPIKDPERLVAMDYEGKLRRVCDKHDTKFIEYRPETGSWVFKVNHFSKYGLSDTDDEENAPVDPKKAKLAVVNDKITGAIPKQKGHSDQNFNKNAMDLSQKFIDDTQNIDFTNNNFNENRNIYSPLSPTTDIAMDIGANPHKIQLMKQSFFADDEFDRRSTISDYMGDRESPDQIVPAKTLSHHYDFNRLKLRKDPYFDSNPNLNYPDIETDSESVYSSSVQTKDISKETNDDKVISRVVILKPKVAFLKLNHAVVPMGQSILKQLTDNCLADMAFMYGRKFRIGWSIQNSLTVLGTHSNLPEKTGKVKLNFSKLFNGRAHDDYSASLVQHLKISSFEKQLDFNLQETIENHLEVELKYSVFNFENDENCPYISSDSGTQGIEEHFEISKTLSHLDEVECFFESVWSLCKVLWGFREELETLEPTSHFTIMCRRQLFSNWLEENITNSEEIFNKDEKKTQSEYLKNLWELLMSHKVADACELAFKNDDINLSLLLSQISGGSAVRQLIDHQLSSWQEVEADKFIAKERLKMFMLIADVPIIHSTHGTLNVFDKLDWINSLALYIWYLCSPTSSITEALVSYEKSFGQENLFSNAPTPPYSEKFSTKSIIFDLRFHLLKLYSKRNYPLEPLLNPITYTSDQMDYRLSWLMLQVLGSLGYNHCSELSESQIHLSFAVQLETQGLWHWAIFVLQHIKDQSRRKLCIQDYLYKYVSLIEDEDYLEKENFIMEKLQISEKWIYWAKAVKAGALHEYHEQAKYLLKAKQWSLAHEVIMQHIVPDAIINDDIPYVKQFLEHFEDTSQISNWLSQGGVIVDYIEISEKFEQLKSVSENDLVTYWDALKPQLAELCSRINLLSCPTAKHRLCQSEIAQKLSCLVRGILLTNDVNPCLVIKVALEKLPLPQEYSQQQSRELIDKYFADTNRHLMES